MCIVRRMPRMQVYLPEDLYQEVKRRRLPASELLQEAVKAEVHRQDLAAEADEYLAQLTEEVGAPSAEDVAHADAVSQRIVRRRARQAS